MLNKSQTFKVKHSILTHDMVHRTHLEIFPTYYPAGLSNWYMDDWITIVYQPGLSHMVRLYTCTTTVYCLAS